MFKWLDMFFIMGKKFSNYLNLIYYSEKQSSGGVQ